MLRSRRLLRSTELTIDGSSPGTPPTAFGPFRVLHQVGAGTTGLVFRAHDPVDGGLVAIKAFRLDLTPERAAELAATLQDLVGRGLSHPSIAAPIAAGVEDGVAWYAQAYVPAESLDSALRQYGPPPAADALTITTQLAGALDFAAAAGVMHGALHPRDVLVAPGETHVVDLGVAVAIERVGLRAPVRRPYNAPERAAGQPIGREGDVFAVAAIAFELLTGHPVTGAGDEGLVTLPEIPGANHEALLETFSFALAMAPDERYTSALAFAAPLKKALGDALTRPVIPRKRRTTRPPDALLPIEPESPAPMRGTEAPDSTGVAVSPPPDTLSLERSAPLTGSTGERGQEGHQSAPARDDVRPLGQRSVELQDPAYLSGPTEPEPAAPAIEPIGEPGTIPPTAPDVDLPLAAIEQGRASALDGVELNARDAPLVDWEVRERPIGARFESEGDERSSGSRDRIVGGPGENEVDGPPTIHVEPHTEQDRPEARNAGDIAASPDYYDSGVSPRTHPVEVSDLGEVRSSEYRREAGFLPLDKGEPGARVAQTLDYEEPPRVSRRLASSIEDGFAEEAAGNVTSRAVRSPTAYDAARSDAGAAEASVRAPWLALAAMLLVGFVAGLGGGWFLFGGRGDRPPATDTASSSGSPQAPAAGREWTDDAVRDRAQARGGASTSPAPSASAGSGVPAAPAGATAPATPLPNAPPPRTQGGSAQSAPRGRLVVRTRPAGARVEVDGKSRGDSPVTMTDLPYGAHTVRVARNGYVPEQRRVTLSARRSAQSLDVPLKRAAAPNQPATPTRRAATQSFVGSVLVESRPSGATVFLDGKNIGVTPLSVPDVPVGSHVVRLELAGHQRWSTSTRVVSGERVRVAASLEEVPAR
jgi:serine/threonine protein kinase